MKRKYSRLSDYWKKALMESIFGKRDECISSALEELDPKVDEASLTIKTEDKMKVYLLIKKCQKANEDE